MSNEYHKIEKYDDGSHGWFKVSKYLLSNLGLSDKITDFSYMKGNYAYLEEDCDASLFFNRFEEVYQKIELKIDYIECEYNDSINPRTFESYKFTPIK